MSEISTVAKEIERKYLLSELPPEIHKLATCGFRVEHGWLPGEIIHERISYNGRTGTFWRVIKTGKGIERIEAQEEISVDFFTLLWPLTKKRISKMRWNVPAYDGMIWEIDSFDAQKLFIAEIEIPTVDTPIIFPKWLEAFIIKEVTEDPTYLNINLAK